MRVLHRGAKAVSVEFRVTARQALRDLATDPKRVKLTLRLDGVEEFRLQMRPNQPKVSIAEARVG